MKLTDIAIRALEPDARTKKYFDGNGLYLEVTPSGSKYWRWKYRFEGKEKRLALGVYPKVSLKEVRLLQKSASILLREGTDPAAQKKEKQAPVITFRHVAEEWLAKQHQWKPNHRRTVVGRLNNDVYNTLGDRPIDDLQPIDFLHTLRHIEARGAHVTAHKVKGICGQICRYAVASCIIPSDPTRDLKGALTPPKRNHFAAFTTKEEAGALMRVIKGYNGFFVTKCALLMTAYTFTRQGELRHAEWSEVDLSERQWIVPAHKMKMKREHIVPLSGQVMELLLDLRKVSGQGKYLFPSLRTDEKPISENTCNGALRRMGFTKEEMTAHGFRAMASSILNEAGYNPDVIEMQLAHVPANKIRAAYNRAQYLPERYKLMQDWADMLDAFESQKR